MKRIFNDPLLSAGRLLTLIGQAIMVIAGAACTLMIGALIFLNGMIMAEVAIEFPTMDTTNFGWILGGLMLCAIMLFVIGYFFLDRLRKIIDSVAAGDPFVPENGQRLSVMGWLALAVQLVTIPAAGLGLALVKLLDPADHADVTKDFTFDPSGLLLVVTLFILARVFKQGAAMREDLEGTV